MCVVEHTPGGLRFHNSVNDLTMSSAALDSVKLQYIICYALSLMRSQYLNPLIDRWVQEKASMGKLCPGTVGRGLWTRLKSVPACLCSPYAQALQIGRTLAASASEKLAFLEWLRCYRIAELDMWPQTRWMCAKLSGSCTLCRAVIPAATRGYYLFMSATGE